MIKVIGAKSLIKKLANTAIVDRELLSATEKSGLAVLKRAQTYPRQRPGSTYRRTGTLGRKWSVAVSRRGGIYTARLRNPTSYAPDVQGVLGQKPVHKGRWPTDRAMLKEQSRKIVGFYGTARRNIMEAFNG